MRGRNVMKRMVMKRMLRRMKQTASVLLAAVMTMTSLPQTGIYVRAVNLTETEIMGESVPSHDGTDGTNTVIGSTYLSANESDYRIDNTQGYILKDANVVAKSYTAQFSAKINQKLQKGYLRILYTADSTLSFFPDETYVSPSSLIDDSYKTLYQNYPLSPLTYSDQPQTDPDNGEYYEITAGIADGVGYLGDRLKPNTTYYYRIVYAPSSTEYYFLTAPQQFTTGASVETSSVTISSPEVEETGYRSARIVWTMENPNDEYIKDHYLKNADTNQTIAISAYVEQYKDADGNIVPGKYYTIIDTKGEPVNVAPVVEVYLGEDSTLTPISAKSLPVGAMDIDKLNFTAELEPSYSTVQIQMQTSPWYEVGNKYCSMYQNRYGDLFYFQLLYRAQGETDWKEPVTYTINSENETLTFGGPSVVSPGTTYEYYIRLCTDSKYTDCIRLLGSEEEPLTFTTMELIVYDDSQFPDDVLRNRLKTTLGLSADQNLTNEKLEIIKTINILELKDPKASVKSLEGIKYIPNLENLWIIDHDITDASIISKVTGLRTITLYGNELTELPDLSGLTSLEDANFNQNKINSGVTEDKLPPGYLESHPGWLYATATRQRFPAATPSQDEIRAMYASLPWSMDGRDTFAVQPSTKNPYAAGRLSDTSLNNALNALNFVRYIAGIPYDVTLDDTYIQMAQAGALVLNVNAKGLDHFPPRPSAS